MSRQRCDKNNWEKIGEEGELHLGKIGFYRREEAEYLKKEAKGRRIGRACV
jgi:hypothetical protein